MPDILVVDDDVDIRYLVSNVLTNAGYSTREAYSVDGALTKIKELVPSIVILDIWLGGHHVDGIGLLKVLRKNYPDLPIIMISGHANAETAALAIKLGAYDFIEKPFKSEKLLLTVKRALETCILNEAQHELRKATQDCFIGVSKAIISIKRAAENAAMSNSRVLIIGECGTGRGHIAQVIHMLSNRNKGKFMRVKLFNVDSSELDRILFGDEATNTMSVFEKTNGGTLLLDEITSIPRSLQPKLLDVLQSSYIKKGSNKIPIDVRIISTTNKEIDELRSYIGETLLSRINVVTIKTAPLRERKRDITFLANRFIHQFSDSFMMFDCSIAESTYAAMVNYDWPGNVRQLRNALEHAVIIASYKNTNVITSDMLPSCIVDNGSAASTSSFIDSVPSFLGKKYKEAKQIFDRAYLNAQLSYFYGNIAKTAQYVGMDRSALHRKMKALGLVLNTQSHNEHDDERDEMTT